MADAPGLKEVVFRLRLRAGAPPRSLPLALAEGTGGLAVETGVTHLDEDGDVWRVLHVHGPAAEVALALRRFEAYDAPFVREKDVLARAPTRLVLWYKYRPGRGRAGISQTALAFRRLGRGTVVTDVARAGELTVRVLARAGPAVARWMEEARALAEPAHDFELLYAGPPRAEAAAALTPEEERALEAAAQVGWFGVPRRAAVRDVARALGVSASAASARLRTAEAKLVQAWLEGRRG